MNEADTITIHLDSRVADVLIEAAGFTRQADTSYTRRNRPARGDGGRFGTDFLWEKDEVLCQALTLIADNMLDRGLAG